MSPKNLSDTDTIPRLNVEINSGRRKLLAGAGVLAAAVITPASGAMDHRHEHGGKNAALIETAFDCLKTGQACLDHCIESFKAGDTKLAECADTIVDLLASCDALSRLASNDSRHLKQFLAGCTAVCKDCEKACRKHEKEHATCKACADSCADCAREMKKIAA